MKRWRSFLMVAFIFGCGVLVGGFVGAALGWVGFFHKAARSGPTGLRDLVMERAAKDLRLDADQRTRVRKILVDMGHDLSDATAGVRPEVEAIVSRTGDRIRAELNPAQRRKFDAFVSAGGRRWLATMAQTNPEPRPREPRSTPSSEMARPAAPR